MKMRSNRILQCFWIGLAVSLTFVNVYGTVGLPPAEFVLKNRNNTVNPYYKITNKNSNQVADVCGCSIMDGIRIIQWSGNGGDNQLWLFIDTGSGYYKIKGKQSGKLLTVYCGSTADGAEIVLWSDIGGDFQLWRKIDTGSGEYKLQNKKSGKLLEVKEASKNEGDPIIQWYDNGGINQLWRLENQ